MTALHAPIGRYAEAPPDEPDYDEAVSSILATRAREAHDDGEGSEVLAYLYDAKYQLHSLLQRVPENERHLFANVQALYEQASALHAHVERVLREWRKAA